MLKVLVFSRLIYQNKPIKKRLDIHVKTLAPMSIRKTGTAPQRDSGFSLRTLKNENAVFCLSLFFLSDTINNNKEH